MTDSATPTPTESPELFHSEDIQSQKRRTEIERQLRGVTWEMEVTSLNTDKGFGFLKHLAFPGNVFFLTDRLRNAGTISRGSSMNVEVMTLWNNTKQAWGFAVKQGEPVSPLQTILKKLEHYASWDQDAGEGNVRDLVAQGLSFDPASQSRMDQAIERGHEARDCLVSFFQLGRQGLFPSPEFDGALADLREQRPDLVDRAMEKGRRGAAAGTRKLESRQRQLDGETLSQVRPPPPVSSGWHPRDIRALQPQAAWTLLIDETGTEFGRGAEDLPAHDRALGRVVGLLMPQNGHRLPPQKMGWHAVDQSIDEIDRVIQSILDAPVGVLGITVHQLPDAPGERWAFGVVRMVDLVLRLMPIEGPTRLEVLIEQRGEFRSGAQWPAVAEQARLRLAEAYPERGQWIDLKIRTIAKQESPHNGCVDALAFIFSGASPHSRACLASSGLAGTCLLSGDAETLTRSLEWLDRGRTLEGRDWAALLAQTDAAQPSNLLATLLQRLGEAARADETLWRRYLDQVMGHFDSRALDLSILGRQVEWLQRWVPGQQALPPSLRLLWLTAQLARANHMGQTEQPWLKEMTALASHLMDEDARLVCRAELNLAVTATNRYDFEQAGAFLRRWNPSETRVAAGLRYWGQVRSSLGQHAAFRGDLAAAAGFFDEALESFFRLSDPEQGRRETRQTLTYRAIVLMDDPAHDAKTVREAVAAVTGSLPEAIVRLARSTANVDKYAHHLLLRWLIHRPEAAAARTYLAGRGHWDHDEGHPWPLIQLYRGLLLHPQDPQSARRLVLVGFTLAVAPDNGPVVQLIGACCRAIAVGWGETWPKSETLLSTLEQILPLAAPRIAKVRAYLVQPGNPLTLLRDVLPFNFR